MPYAVTLRLDEAAAAEVRRLWALVAAGDAAEYAPHVTLAVYPDDGDVGLLRDAVAVLAARWRALEVTFAGIGVFAGAVVWLAPVATGCGGMPSSSARCRSRIRIIVSARGCRT